ncbi:methyl-accepting chemotaxis protein [Paenibacillus whitsoniae]|uniref:Methyl-accepting chemotaxis protein n=1 Tax=Paenibacillus whitsoniae TaxID=2496558 RepID=A0A430JGF6_9BACL|nr:methyl-accepting chemotaxis protein [Paenibacillus whitsoniae]
MSLPEKIVEDWRNFPNFQLASHLKYRLRSAVKLKTKNYFGKNLLFSMLNLLVIGVVLISVSAYFQSNLLTKTLREQTHNMTSVWAQGITYKDVQGALSDKKYDASEQQRLTKLFDSYTAFNANVAQAYIFGVELQDGNKTSLIAFPSHVVKAFQEAGLKIGDMYEQPKEIANGLRSMLKTKTETFTSFYSDDYGTWVSVLYPIMDDSGNVAAYFAVDVNAKMIPEAQKSFLLSSIILLLIALVICGGAQYFVAQRTLMPINQLMRGIEQASNGKFNFTLEEKGGFGELNQTFNAMLANMRDILTSIKTTATHVAETSNQLSGITEDNRRSLELITTEIRDMNTHVDQQKTSTEECGRSVVEIAASLQAIAQNASQVAHASQDMKNLSEEGNAAAQSISDQMGLINTNSISTASAIKLLESKSGEIGDILSLIKDITAQTNLLALNASIEAARAGEHGRGFAIVADEVRKLAEQSKNSTSQIETLVADIQAETYSAVTYVTKGTDETEKGLDIAKSTGESFNNIWEASQVVSHQVLDISSATQEMSASTEQVTAMMGELESISRKTANSTSKIMDSVLTQESSLQSISTYAGKLSTVAEQLGHMVGKFEIEMKN